MHEPQFLTHTALAQRKSNSIHQSILSCRLDFLSINRFERKKNIGLAISAFANLYNVKECFEDCSLQNASLTIVGKSLDRLILSSNYLAFHKNKMVMQIIECLCVCIVPCINDRTVPGGYDNRLRENVECLAELKDLAEKEGVSQRVTFITSCSTTERNTLLSQCLCVIYTPVVPKPFLDSFILFLFPCRTCCEFDELSDPISAG